jgi:antitoxin component of MazEF toxin-antitoxin module
MNRIQQIGQKGSFFVVIPREVATSLGIQKGDRVRWEFGSRNSLVLRMVKGADGTGEAETAKRADAREEQAAK